MQTEVSKVEVAIVDVLLLNKSLALDNNLTPDKTQVGFALNAEFGLGDENSNIVGLKMKLIFFNNLNKSNELEEFASIEFACRYLIKQSKPIMRIQGDERFLNIDINTMKFLISNTYDTGRGIMYSEIRGTRLETVVVPMITKDVLNHFANNERQALIYKPDPNEKNPKNK
jgi:hypothetical protein